MVVPGRRAPADPAAREPAVYVTPAIRTDHALPRFAALAIAAAVATMALKFAGYALTGSVGLLSDAIESSANLLTAIVALFAVWYAARPADRTHNYGHEKVEFFAAGIEGALVLVAAVSVGVVEGEAVLDLDYLEDKDAAVDLNLVMTETGQFVEVQGAGEESTFSHEQFLAMLALGKKGVTDLLAAQQAVLAIPA